MDINRTKKLLLCGGMLLGATLLPQKVLACGAEPMLGQICQVGFNFAPRGSAQTNGQLLQISQYSALFSLLGTTFGGDGETTFALPDLRGRVAIHPGQGPGLSAVSWGQKGGIQSVTLTISNMPSHSHGATTTVDTSIDSTGSMVTLRASSSNANSTDPAAMALADGRRNKMYQNGAPDVDMHADAALLTLNIGANSTATTTVQSNGLGNSFENRQPFLGIYHVIALQGIFPSRS
ncbi:phage tail protein [uncultured Paraglaciecola sp.]|uniref:phage tail protein n=1 Tax=uncultured Paraglaciecola sp. TaxID=1765024 RepID=UPI0026111B50|nr:tail fiber protein [uncultured Paraglaciecola sp.]